MYLPRAIAAAFLIFGETWEKALLATATLATLTAAPMPTALAPRRRGTRLLAPVGRHVVDALPAERFSNFSWSVGVVGAASRDTNEMKRVHAEQGMQVAIFDEAAAAQR
jgi:hypothetical protein